VRACVKVGADAENVYARVVLESCVFHTVGYPLVIVEMETAWWIVLFRRCIWLDGSVEVTSGMGVTIVRGGTTGASPLSVTGVCSRLRVSAGICNFVSYCPPPTELSVSGSEDETASESVSESGGQTLSLSLTDGESLTETGW
jgi:hypothetical protein